MKYAYIAPVQYLGMIPVESDYHLLLAHLLKNREYSNFYKEKAERGDFIIIDNGAYENGYPMESSLLMAEIHKSGIMPSCIVAPDYPNEDWWKTYKSYHKFRDEIRAGIYGDDYKSVQIMAVPQSVSGDYEGWLKCYDNMIGADMLGMSILAIPNAFHNLTGTKDISFNRLFAMLLLEKRCILDKNTKHHYLGGSSPREVIMMALSGIAYGTDSSSPIWHGILGIRYDYSVSGLSAGKSGIPVDFNIEFDEKRIDDIKFNIDIIEYFVSKVQELS